MSTALTWFEIPVCDLEAAQHFYETVLGRALRREAIDGQSLAVFPYDPASGVGGCLMAGPRAPAPSAEGVRVYLDAGAALDPVLARAVAAGARLVVPRTALPPGMGFFAQVADPEGNVVGLHAMA